MPGENWSFVFINQGHHGTCDLTVLSNLLLNEVHSQATIFNLNQARLQ